MPSSRPAVYPGQPALRRGPIILTIAALVVLLVAALGGLGVISRTDAAGSSGADRETSGSADATADTAASTTASTTPPTGTSAVGTTSAGTTSASPLAGAPVVDAPGAAKPNGFALAIGTFFDALAEPAEDAPTSSPVAPTVVQTTPPAGTDQTALPANSGSGKRVVYAINAQRVWLVEADGKISRTYPVSGRLDRPAPGTYQVYSRSSTAVSFDYTASMRYMVRFARGDRAAIGFHDIPVDQAGKQVQTVAQLGQPLSAGCVRQAEEDAIALWNWAPLGTTVVVVA